MNDVFPKFIIQGDSLIMSRVTYHRELKFGDESVKGGGWFNWNEDTNTFTFRGSSEDFGQAKIDDIKECIKNDKVFTNPFSDESVAKKHNFFYWTGVELINLKPPSNKIKL